MFRFCETENILRIVKKRKSIFSARMFADLCGSIHWNLLCNYSASSRPIFVSLFALHLQHVFQTHVCSYNLHTPNSVCKPFFLDRCDWRLASSELLSQSRLTVCHSLCELYVTCSSRRTSCVFWVSNESGAAKGQGFASCLNLSPTVIVLDLGVKWGIEVWIVGSSTFYYHI